MAVVFPWKTLASYGIISVVRLVLSETEIRETLAELLRRGWTKAAVADEIGVSWDSISRWMSGRGQPANTRMVLMGLERLLRRTRVPKRRRYTRRRNPGEEGENEPTS
jgi:hypothetical protein